MDQDMQDSVNKNNCNLKLGRDRPIARQPTAAELARFPSEMTIQRAYYLDNLHRLLDILKQEKKKDIEHGQEQILEQIRQQVGESGQTRGEGRQIGAQGYQGERKGREPRGHSRTVSSRVEDQACRQGGSSTCCS